MTHRSSKRRSSRRLRANEADRDPRLPPRGERTGGPFPTGRVYGLAKAVVRNPLGALIQYRVDSNRTGKLFQFTEIFLPDHEGGSAWVTSRATTSSRKVADGWLAAVRAMLSERA